MTLSPSIFLVLVSTSLLISCNDHTGDSAIHDKPLNIDSINCFAYINNQDTVTLKTTSQKGIVTGTLAYNFYGKDKNTGVIRGEMKGQILVADYTFISEGVNSIRQVAFKKDKGNFIEGYGESEEKNGKMVFKNIDSLDFSNSIILGAVACGK